jgi:hypothetical protein
MTASDPSVRSTTPRLPAETVASLARLQSRAWGVSVGLLLALVLFVATVLLVIRGGPDMGQHLQLLGVFLPGYSVSYVGAFVGFVYMFVFGYAIGRLIGVVYNRVARLP